MENFQRRAIMFAKILYRLNDFLLKPQKAQTEKS